MVLLLWRLVTGPIEADFLTPHLERQLTTEAMRVEIGHARLRWDGLGRPIRLVATDTLVERAGRQKARLPAVALSLDPRALIDGALANCTLGEMVQAMADVYGRYTSGPEW